MSGIGALLERLADAGVRVRVDGEDLVCCPKERLTDQLRDELRRYKSDLLPLLRWSDEEAFELIRECLAYVAARYDGGPVDALREPGDEIDQAFKHRDAHGLRVACRRYARAANSLFKNRRKTA